MHRRKMHLGTAGMQEARLGDTDGGRQAVAGEKGCRGKAQNVSEGKKLDGYGRAAGATPVKTPPISFPREELVRVSQSEGSKYAASFPPTESETIERVVGSVSVLNAWQKIGTSPGASGVNL